MWTGNPMWTFGGCVVSSIERRVALVPLSDGELVGVLAHLGADDLPEFLGQVVSDTGEYDESRRRDALGGTPPGGNSPMGSLSPWITSVGLSRSRSLGPCHWALNRATSTTGHVHYWWSCS
jgi:hypothetical protein